MLSKSGLSKFNPETKEYEQFQGNQLVRGGNCEIYSDAELKSGTLGQHTWAYVALERQIKSLQGNVLTIIEAAIGDKTQLQALKTIINKTFSDRLNHIYKISFSQDVIDQTEGEGIIAESFSEPE